MARGNATAIPRPQSSAPTYERPRTGTVRDVSVVESTSSLFDRAAMDAAAKFKYKPVVGVPNYLYWMDGEWSLSLIAPDEWSDARRAGFAGTCILHPDMTWTIEPSDLLADDNPVSDAVARFYDGFAEMLAERFGIEHATLELECHDCESIGSGRHAAGHP